MTKSVTIRGGRRGGKARQLAQKAGRAVAIAAWSDDARRLTLTLSQPAERLRGGLWALSCPAGEEGRTLVFELHQD